LIDSSKSLNYQHGELINEFLASLVAVVAQSPQILLGLIKLVLGHSP